MNKIKPSILKFKPFSSDDIYLLKNQENNNFIINYIRKKQVKYSIFNFFKQKDYFKLDFYFIELLEKKSFFKIIPFYKFNDFFKEYSLKRFSLNKPKYYKTESFLFSSLDNNEYKIFNSDFIINDVEIKNAIAFKITLKYLSINGLTVFIINCQAILSNETNATLDHCFTFSSKFKDLPKFSKFINDTIFTEIN